LYAFGRRRTEPEETENVGGDSSESPTIG
jgi:hypothetical protein